MTLWMNSGFPSSQICQTVPGLDWYLGQHKSSQNASQGQITRSMKVIFKWWQQLFQGLLLCMGATEIFYGRKCLCLENTLYK